ncbi:hypothetical protein [Pseudonocardia sp. TRM90224]|uniref:hypothetical protein n=1 Tax=Pseudonocardia sp. TRM90224 TaxID=2812678 RepID=UPI001E44A1C2|nr:hypothetical protein [Pseudonocardia sp. TRM90224]
MDESERRSHYRAEAAALAEVGEALADVDIPTVMVRLPPHLAQLAVDAWERDDSDDGADGGSSDETADEYVDRHRAAMLALIGIAVAERGTRDVTGQTDDVVVELDVDLVAQAQEAALEASDTPA